MIQGLRKNYDRAMTEEAVLDSEGKETGNYRYNGNVANRALELIGKELGMFLDRKAITVEDLRRLPGETILGMISELEDDDVDDRTEAEGSSRVAH